MFKGLGFRVHGLVLIVQGLACGVIPREGDLALGRRGRHDRSVDFDSAIDWVFA